MMEIILLIETTSAAVLVLTLAGAGCAVLPWRGTNAV